MNPDLSPQPDLSALEAQILASIPPPPREVPSGFRRKQLYGSVVIFGAIFAVIGAGFLLGAVAILLSTNELWAAAGLAGLGLVFGVIGAMMFRNARRTGKRHLAALAHGAAGVANVTASHLDTSLEVNGRNPWKISYVFFVDDVSFHGSLSTWDIGRGEAIAKGAQVGVVYLPESPKVNCLYPII